MVRIYIELDKEKMEREGVYSFEKMQRYIDERIAANGGYKDEEGWYTGGTWEGFMALAMYLLESDWFKNNVKKMLWNNRDYEHGPDDIYIEDMLEETRSFREKQRRKERVSGRRGAFR